MSKRDLTWDDVRAVMALAAEQPARETYKAVERLAKETCGWRLLTILKYVEAEGAVERLSSSDEKSYAIGGRKPLDKLTENQRIMDRGDIALAATREDVKRLFFDHELIFSLGITAIMNVPVRHAGRRLGTLNFCGEEGMYGEREKQIGRVLAGLLAPALLEAGTTSLSPHA
jgi:GAF domain-containing protein